MEYQFNTVEEALEELRAGHLILTIDDPDRENEGDLICAAQFATTENVKMIYVIPDFQNPSGRTWPLERRKQFMDIINKYEIPVVEDNPTANSALKASTCPRSRAWTPRASLSSSAPSPRSWRPATVWAGSAPTARSSRSTTSSRRPLPCRLPPRHSSLSPSSSTCSTSTSTLPPSRSATASAATS